MSMIQGKPAEDPATKAFRDGEPIGTVKAVAGAEAEPAAAAPVAEANDREREIQLRAMKQRINKTMRVTYMHSLYLRDYAAQKSRENGEKISESDILEEALTEFFKRRKFPAS